MNSKSLAIAVMTTAFTATMVSAHLPSATMARQQIGRAYDGTNTRAALNVKDAVKWEQYQPQAGGALVEKGDFEGIPLYWTSAWWAEKSDVPGEFADSGGTSPWGLINSYSFTQGKEYQWVGWNDEADKWEVAKKAGTHDITETKTGTWGPQIQSKGPGAYIPTWRDGAEGAYSIIQDDIGAMDIERSVQPANDVGYEHPRIRVGWGVKVDVMDATEWKRAQSMVMDGHELINHSWDHSSAAEQWQWHYHGDVLSIEDPALPKEIRGLTIDSTLSNTQKLVCKVPYIDYKNGDAFQPDTLINEVTFEVSSDYKADSTVVSHGDWDEVMYTNSGKIKAVHTGWSDDAAANVKMLKVFCVPGWADQPSRSDINIRVAKETMDEKLYSQVQSPRFPEGKRTDYYAYPYDAYSNKTHDLLLADGHVAARGGAKSGMPIPGDFFQPFRIDFDAFFMLDEKALTVFPDNPHQRLSLPGLVERIIKTKGYMIREFHSTTDVSYWDDANDQAKGGWWGGIPKSLYKEHFVWVDQLIDENKITVYTATEAVKYRLTANSATGATISGNTLTVQASGCPAQYQDEISVIVKLDQGYDKMAAQYADGSFPRYAPRKMDSEGKAWSISVNPYKDGGKIELKPNEDHKNDWKTVEEIKEIGGVGGNTSISDNAVKDQKTNAVSEYKLTNNQVSLNLAEAGTYKVDVFSVTGRKIASTSVTGNVGLVKTGLSTADLGAGMFIMNVTKAGVSVMNTKLLVK